MVTPRTQQLIREWRRRGDDASDQFVKFFIFYMCLDAWISAESLKPERQKREWLVDTNNTAKAAWYELIQEDKMKSAIDVLLKKGMVYNTDPRSEYMGEPKVFDDPENFGQAVDFLYQIRCNLFHGGKSPDDSNDFILITASATIIQRWLEKIMASYRTNRRIAHES